MGATVDHLLFKSNHIYQHYVLRVNYTTYNVRCRQDILNLTTNHHDIMMLASPENMNECHHHFCYACIIGIYHANVQYIGSGLSDYLPCQLDFFLDVLRFPPMNDHDTFDFIDPADILRGCHLIPAFAKGRSHPDCTSLSPIAKDSDDWNYYYVNRHIIITLCYRKHTCR
ncbi:hypothetical protein EDC04DRAFT_2872767 [Pisolithus marmoratus]|nr:hypothetical protein EDC04DRAFT_2872767 [Pisolithus marmoratus]